MTETLLVQKVAYIHAIFSRKRMASVSFISFEKYELRMRKNFPTYFFISFLPKKAKYEKKLTSISSKKVAYETLVQWTKPWTLYSVSVLRYRGSKMNKTGTSKVGAISKAQEAQSFLNMLGTYSWKTLKTRSRHPKCAFHALYDWKITVSRVGTTFENFFENFF